MQAGAAPEEGETALPNGRNESAPRLRKAIVRGLEEHHSRSHFRNLRPTLTGVGKTQATTLPQLPL